MIEGLKLEIQHDELKQLLVDRAAYHRKRAAEKEAELPIIKASWEKLKTHQAESVAVINKMSYSHSEDPTVQLESDIKEHKNKAVVFEFFANHLFHDVYSLSETDLIRLEIVKRT